MVNKDFNPSWGGGRGGEGGGSAGGLSVHYLPVGAFCNPVGM